ncbi:MAG TPA: hypothetical protein VGF55_17885 [Gemmataceae bacterium]|jgi:hypothetical protein
MRVLFLTLVLVTAGCQRPAAPAPAPAGPKSPAGWEVRYNAALALARRGSPHVKDAEVWDTLLEMLDEDQQLKNIPTKLIDDRMVPDETDARRTVIGALQAVQELHRKRPEVDVSGLREPIDKLTRSPNATVAVQAKQALLVLFPPA